MMTGAKGPATSLMTRLWSIEAALAYAPLRQLGSIDGFLRKVQVSGAPRPSCKGACGRQEAPFWGDRRPGNAQILIFLTFIQSVPDPQTRGSVIQESASGIVGGFGFGSSLRMI
jgi:hypothetical protein